MKPNEISILVNSAISLVELIVRLRNDYPGNFANEKERLERLRQITRELESKPPDYLQTWEPKEDEL